VKEWTRCPLRIKKNRIYIIPTKNGLIFIGGIVAIIATGVVYNNNLVLLLGFFLFSIFIISMLGTYQNLRHLTLEAMPVPDQHAKEPTSLPLKIINKGRSQRQMIDLSPWRKELKFGQPFQLEEIRSDQQIVCHLVLAPMTRGVHYIPRISLSTVYPLGLFCAWTVLDVEGEFFLYPKPLGNLPLRLAEKENKIFNSEMITSGHQSIDEFFEHKKFQRSENFRRIDWKIFSRRGKLMVKSYESKTDKCFSVRFYDVPCCNEEEVLSQLSQWLSQAREREGVFELVLPNCKIPFGFGTQHYQKCQRELARYGGAG